MKKVIYIITATLLLSHGLYAQVEQLRSGTSQGAKWTSGGVYTNFGIAGQYGIASQVGGGNYSGNIGFMFYADAQSAVNEVPIAFDDRTNFFLELSDKIELTGIDPEGDAIEFIIQTPASQLNLVQEGELGELIKFSPKAGLIPDQVYSDSIKFIVREVESGVESEIATVLFRFLLEDTPHYVAALDRVSTDFTVQFVDTVKNAGYTLDINYYDLSDINNPVFVPIIQSEQLIDDFAVSNDTLSYTFSVDENVHDHLFNASQVFTTVLITSDNGYSDFAAYMIDNSSGSGKVSGTEDGQFWVIGSEQTVPENKTVMLNMMAVEFSDSDMTNATIEILVDPTKGDLGTVVQTEAEDNLITWEVPYTSTQEVGGLDSLQFRIFHPGRNLFDSTYVQIEIIDVNDPPSIEALFDRQMQEDGTLTLDVNYSDPDNDLEVVASSNETSNVTVSESDGVITIDPAPNFFGSTIITVVATEKNTDESFVAIETFNLDIISTNDPPEVASVANQQIEEDNIVNIVLSASDPDTDFQQFDYFASSDNPGIAKTEIVGNLLSIIPEKNVNGSVVITVQANDRTGSENSLSAVSTFSVEFTAVNDSPEITNTLSTQVLVQDFPGYDIDLEDNFFDAETEASALTYSVANNSNVNVSFNGSVASITTANGFFGNEDVTFTASDGNLSVDMIVSFVVNQKDANIQIATPPATVMLMEDFGTYTLSISGVFDDINTTGEVFTYDLAGASTTNYTIDNVNETITFNSIENFYGTESLLLIGTTNNKSSYTPLDITIEAVNDAPKLVTLANQTIFEDGLLDALFIDVSDVDNSLADLSVSATSNNQSIIPDADLIINQVNGFYYLSATPLANQNGIVDITVLVSDGMLSKQKTFSLDIGNVNDTPVLTGNVINDATEDMVFSQSVASLFEDADGDVLTFTVENKPDWLVFENNELQGSPSNDDVGIINLQIKAQDSFEAELSEIFTFNVDNSNDAPEIVTPLGDITILQENSFSYLFPTSAFVDVDQGDLLTFSVEKYPDWATLSGNNLSGIPQYEDIGKDTIIFKAMDDAGLFAVDTVLVTVEFTVYDVTIDVNDIAICLGETAILEASGAVDFNWFDVDGNVLQSGDASFDNAPNSTVDIFVEGVDAFGHTTPEKVKSTITVNPIPNVELTQTEESVSVPENANATYQWFDGTSVIDDATTNTYTPTNTGEYSVKVTSEFGCAATSETLIFIITGLELDDYSLEIFPNPTTDYLHITGVGNLSDLIFEVVDMSGKLYTVPVESTPAEKVINIGLLKGGQYALKIKSSDSVESFRFIKK